MNSKKKLLVGMLLLAVGLATAVSEYECIDYYNSAKTYLNSNDYQNALRSIYRSRECYEAITIASGVAKCDQIISQINATLTQQQMADTYYRIAGDYFLLGGDTIENMNRVVVMAQNADNIYKRLGDSDGILKSESLVTDASAKIERIKASRLEDANALLAQATTAYLAGDYLASRTYALNASQLYSSIPEPTGMGKTATLLTNIDESIRGIRINAAASYDKSLRLLVERNCDEAKTWAVESNRLYNRIKDKDGVDKTTSLISNIDDCLSTDKETRLRNARSYFVEAQELYIVQDYANASRKASDAKAIYKALYDKAWVTEQNMYPEQRVQTNLYSAYIKEVDALINKIQTVWGAEERRKQAEKSYQQAQEEYLNNNLESALSYARNARNLFYDLPDYVGGAKSDSLIEQINSKMDSINQAELYLTKAREYYSIADFENANYQATQAKGIYDQISYSEKSMEVQSYISRILNGSAVKTNANNRFNTARNALENGDYAGAVNNARTAKQLYAQVNYTTGVTESDKILKEAEGGLAEEESKVRNTMIVGVLAVLIVGLAIYTWMRKQRKFETEVKEKRAIEEQKIRMREEELSIRKEEEVKERVEDELRKLIEKERDMGDEEGGRKNA